MPDQSGERGCRDCPIPNDAWKFYPDERHPSDVAVCPIGEFATAADGETVAFDRKTICLKGKNSIAATESVIVERKIGVGEEIVITGLFRSHFGNQRNIPIVRIGNIAMLKEEPAWTRYPGGSIDAHLIEVRSIGGLSGSPVFVNLPPFRIVDRNFAPLEAGEPQFYLFGMMHGHFDFQNIADDAAVHDDPGTSINSGVGVVIPVDKIIERSNSPISRQADAKRQFALGTSAALRRIKINFSCRELSAFFLAVHREAP